jgi:hypothetical protein
MKNTNPATKSVVVKLAPLNKKVQNIYKIQQKNPNTPIPLVHSQENRLGGELL